MENDIFFTAQELAKMLRVSPQALHEMRKARLGPPFVRIRRVIRYPKDSVNQWLKDQTGLLQSE
jgi:predicted DNA-binding transcriptional regulator AlpA